MAVRIKAIIFDLDGLVLDSEATYISAWRQAAAEMGYDLTDTFSRSLSGLHGQSVSERLQSHFGVDFDLDAFRQLSGKIWTMQVRQQGIPVKKGFFTVMHTVERLGLPFCLATNSRRHDALLCLELAGIGQIFRNIVTREDVVHGKPAPDIFIAAMAALGQAASDCLVLEDSPVGVEAAVSAGAPCVYVPSIYPPDEAAAAAALAVLVDLDQAAGFISAISHGVLIS